MLDGAHEIAKEEISDLDNITEEDLESYSERLFGLIKKLKEDTDESVDEHEAE